MSKKIDNTVNEEKISFCITIIRPIITPFLEKSDEKYIPFNTLFNVHEMPKEKGVFAKHVSAAISRIGKEYGFLSTRNTTVGHFLYKGERKIGTEYRIDNLVEKISPFLVPYLESNPQKTVLSLNYITELLNQQDIPDWKVTKRQYQHNQAIIRIAKQFGYHFYDDNPLTSKNVLFRTVETETKNTRRGRPPKMDLVLVPYIPSAKRVVPPAVRKYSSPAPIKSKKLSEFLKLTGQN